LVRNSSPYFLESVFHFFQEKIPEEKRKIPLKGKAFLFQNLRGISSLSQSFPQSDKKKTSIN